MPCGSGDTKAYIGSVLQPTMSSQEQAFAYSLNEIATLERTLSPERFRTYVSMAKGNRKTAVQLYERNVARQTPAGLHARA